MGPTGLPFDQIGIEKIATVIIEAGDEIPFHSGQRRPEVMGAVMLDQFANIVGQNLPGMCFFRPFGKIKASGLGFFNDRRDRDVLPIMIPETIPDVGIVITTELDLGIGDHFLLQRKFEKNVLFDFRPDAMRDYFSAVFDGKGLRISSKALEQGKNAAASELKDCFQVVEPDLIFAVSAQEIPDLDILKRLVKLFGHEKISLQLQGIPGLNGPVHF